MTVPGPIQIWHTFCQVKSSWLQRGTICNHGKKRQIKLIAKAMFPQSATSIDKPTNQIHQLLYGYSPV